MRAAIRVGAAGLDSPQQVVVDLHHCTKGLDRTKSDRITAAGAAAIAWPMRRTDHRCRAECAVRGAADARAGWAAGIRTVPIVETVPARDSAQWIAAQRNAAQHTVFEGLLRLGEFLLELRVLGTLLLVHLRARARSGAACSASVALLCAGVDWVGLGGVPFASIGAPSSTTQSPPELALPVAHA